MRRYQSGQIDRSGWITKRGSPLLPWALNQAAWAAIRSSDELRAFYLRVGGAGKKRRKPATRAVMQEPLAVGWATQRAFAYDGYGCTTTGAHSSGRSPADNPGGLLEAGLWNRRLRCFGTRESTV